MSEPGGQGGGADAADAAGLLDVVESGDRASWREAALKLGRLAAADGAARAAWHERLAAQPAPYAKARLLAVALGAAERNVVVAFAVLPGGERFASVVAGLDGPARKVVLPVAGKLVSVVGDRFATLEERVAKVSDGKAKKPFADLYGLYCVQRLATRRVLVARGGARLMAASPECVDDLESFVKGSAVQRVFAAGVLAEAQSAEERLCAWAIRLARDEATVVWKAGVRAWGRLAAIDGELLEGLGKALDDEDDVHLQRHAHAALGALSARLAEIGGAESLNTVTLPGAKDPATVGVRYRDELARNGSPWIRSSAVITLGDAVVAGAVDADAADRVVAAALDDADPVLRINLPDALHAMLEEDKTRPLARSALADALQRLGHHRYPDPEESLVEAEYQRRLVGCLATLVRVEPDAVGWALERLEESSAGPGCVGFAVRRAALEAAADLLAEGELAPAELGRLAAILDDPLERQGLLAAGLACEDLVAGDELALLTAWSGLLDAAVERARRLGTASRIDAVLDLAEGEVPDGSATHSRGDGAALVGLLDLLLGGERVSAQALALPEGELRAALAEAADDPGAATLRPVYDRIERIIYFEEDAVVGGLNEIGGTAAWSRRRGDERARVLATLSALVPAEHALSAHLRQSFAEWKNTPFPRLASLESRMSRARRRLIEERVTTAAGNKEVARVLLRAVKESALGSPAAGLPIDDVVFLLQETGEAGHLRKDLATLTARGLETEYLSAPSRWLEHLYCVLFAVSDPGFFRDARCYSVEPAVRDIFAAAQEAADLLKNDAGAPAARKALRVFNAAVQAAANGAPATAGHLSAGDVGAVHEWLEQLTSCRVFRVPGCLEKPIDGLDSSGEERASFERLAAAGGQPAADFPETLETELKQLDAALGDLFSADPERLSQRDALLREVESHVATLGAALSGGLPLFERELLTRAIASWSETTAVLIAKGKRLLTALQGDDTRRVYEEYGQFVAGMNDEEERSVQRALQRWFLSRYDWWHAYLLRAQALMRRSGRQGRLSTLRGYLGAPFTVNLWLPRLLVSILVGYTPLAMENTMWDLTAALSPAMIVLTAVLSALGSWAYFSFEVAHRVGGAERHRALAVRRAAPIFAIGVVESLVLAVVITAVAGSTMYWLSPQAAQALAADGSFGHVAWTPFGASWLPQALRDIAIDIYPKVILLWAPLALFVGVIIQQIWEEKGSAEEL